MVLLRVTLDFYTNFIYYKLNVSCNPGYAYIRFYTSLSTPPLASYHQLLIYIHLYSANHEIQFYKNKYKHISLNSKFVM